MSALPPDPLLPIDISRWRHGNTGIDWAWSWAAAKPGPHVAIFALMHGNEVCGAHALDALLAEEVRPASGRLSLVFANIAAYERFDPAQPQASRFVDEDMNRVWSPAVLDGPRQSRELARARALRPLVDTIDHLLDLHSMQLPSPPLMLTGMTPRALALARRLGVPEHLVRDAGHAAGARLRDYGDFAAADSPRSALLIECGQHWARPSRALALEASRRFLGLFGIGPAPASGPAQRVITVTEAVTMRTDGFTFAEEYNGLEVIPRAGTVVGRDGDVAVTTPYDECVLIMPTRRMVAGQTAVRFGRFSEA